MIRLKNEKSYKTSLLTGIYCIRALMKDPTYSNSKRINILFGYINDLKKNVSNSDLDESILEEDVDIDKIYLDLYANEFKAEYKESFKEFRKLYK